MSNFLGKLLMSASDDEHPVEVASSKTKKNSSVRPHEKRFVLGALVLSAVLCILSSKNPWFCQSKFLGIATGNPW